MDPTSSTTAFASWPLRRLRAACAATLLMAGLPAAHAALICDAGVDSVPVLDPLARSAAIGELTVACGGGARTDPLLTINFVSFFGFPVLQDTTPILTDGATKYAGTFSGINAVAFLGIPLDPFASAFAIHNIFVDPSLLTPGTLVTAVLSLTGEIGVPLNDPQQLVATVGDLPGGTVPEPATGLLLAAGLGALLSVRRKVRASTPA